MAIFRKRNGKWQYRIYFYDEGGKRRERSRSNFTTKREAQMAAAKEESKLLNNTFVMDQNVRFDTFALEWLETFKRPHVKESTYDRISRTVKNHLIPQFGEYRLIDINRVMYQKWINEKVEVYSLGTVRSFHSTFSSILDHALLDMNLIEKNPAHRIRISKRDDTPDEDDDVLEFLEMDELNRLLAYLEATPHGKYKRSIQYLALFTLIARTGLRVGEALALEWEDIDLDAGTVRVNKTLSFGSKLELKVTKPKTKKANRTLRIDSQTKELMQRHRTSQKEVYLAYPNYKKPELPLVFHSPNGKWLRTSIVRDYLRDACKKSGVQHISPHVLRHSHAVHLLEAGADVKYVADRLGHADTKITMNIYLHVSKKIEHDAMELYEKRIDSLSEASIKMSKKLYSSN
ncbi:tyrosine-type recombinase/integrase [Exiguobacterium sp. s163]|uniref:tyrosine-type recombinase/integrase n=1 Tax=Exiguobacterium sp. s163 TaxID=2751287 RepID=UPI001BEA0175|nr:tyrosine-type recombinase/integrase [Exiguobacterium sp. s163]